MQSTTLVTALLESRRFHSSLMAKDMTMAHAPLEPFRAQPSMALQHPSVGNDRCGDSSGRQFKIKSADSFVMRQSAKRLIEERYKWRGYETVSLPVDQTANRITLTAIEGTLTIGTITIGLDDAEGMNCEEVYSREIDGLRASGRRLCEFTRLAIDPNVGSKRVLAGLFHVAYIVSSRLRKYDALVMEVSTRHVSYYKRMLGAQVIGEQRLNPAVNTQGVLLFIDFSYIAQQILAVGGQPDRAATCRSLYPFAFTPGEEEVILARLMENQTPASNYVN